MPSLRLSDGEIGDLSAYLLSKRNEEFEKLEVGTPDFETQKKVLKLYLLRDPKMAPATAAKVDSYVAELKPHEVVNKLGKAAMTRYGCYGCHEFKGFEKAQGNGVELSDWGSKPTNKLDFGLQEMEHSNYNWAHGKLENTRIWDKGVVKEYLDLLRMPNYEMIEEDRNSVVTALLGMTSQKIAAPAAKVLSSRETIMEEGQRVVHQYNCQGCHMIEGMYQALSDDDPNKEEHEKHKWDLEGRILSYYSEDETLGPPPLVTEGTRVRSDWVHGFLNNPSHRLRVKLKVRMPSFQMTNEEVNKVVSYWAAQGNLPFPVAPLERVTLTATQTANAKALFNKLQCANCHTVGRDATPAEIAEEGSSKGLAPNLARAHGRLNKDWIVQLLKEPGKMVPGTRMPGYWPEMQSPAPEIMGGDSKAQMDLLADYVLSLGQGGLGTKPEAEMKPVSIQNQSSGMRVSTANSK
jgi:mono/diheme cytochrome c family protein